MAPGWLAGWLAWRLLRVSTWRPAGTRGGGGQQPADCITSTKTSTKRSTTTSTPSASWLARVHTPPPRSHAPAHQSNSPLFLSPSSTGSTGSTSRIPPKLASHFFPSFRHEEAELPSAAARPPPKGHTQRQDRRASERSTDIPLGLCYCCCCVGVTLQQVGEIARQLAANLERESISFTKLFHFILHNCLQHKCSFTSFSLSYTLSLSLSLSRKPFCS